MLVGDGSVSTDFYSGKREGRPVVAPASVSILLDEMLGRVGIKKESPEPEAASVA